MSTVVKEGAGRYVGRKSAADSALNLIGVEGPGLMRAIEMAESGFEFRVVEKLSKEAGMPLKDLAELAQIAVRTLSRRKAEGQLTPAESDRVLRAARVISRAAELFEGNQAESQKWLNAPQAAFGGRSPFSVARTDAGAREVENLIGRLEHGVFS